MFLFPASKARQITVGILLVIVVALYVIKTFFIGYYRIPQNGMYPGLPAGSRLLSVRRAYSSAAEVKRGDIVLFTHEEDGQKYLYIWRVVGLPGEKIEASGESLTINGQPVQQDHVRDADGKGIYREQNGAASYEVAFETSPQNPPPDCSVTVPPGQLFVMGDNRFDARDSRYFGPIPFASIIGRKL